MATQETITSPPARNLIVDPINARSYLVVPVDRPEQIDKAYASGADIVILDLEDMVAPHAKIAARSQGVARLLFGTSDFRLDLGITGDDEELLYFRSRVVLISRLADLAAPVDGVCASTAEDSRVRDDTRRAKRMGFGGKLCIHPKQISTINECFRPSSAEIASRT
jgi:citrate lyase subunit beta / citryl-CoA lyase